MRWGALSVNLNVASGLLCDAVRVDEACAPCVHNMILNASPAGTSTTTDR